MKDPNFTFFSLSSVVAFCLILVSVACFLLIRYEGNMMKVKVAGVALDKC